MNEPITVNPNPFVRLAQTLPSGIGGAIALGGRVAGSVIAAAIAVTQDYESTRIFAATIAFLAAATCLPFPSGVRIRFAWLGAALLFFGGAILAHLPAGVLMLLCGVVTAMGASIEEQQRGLRTSVLFFFAGFGIVMALVFGIVLGRGG